MMTVLCNTKYALNKLWQLAIISELIEKVKTSNKHYKDKPVANIIDQLAGGVNTDTALMISNPGVVGPIKSLQFFIALFLKVCAVSITILLLYIPPYNTILVMLCDRLNMAHYKNVMWHFTFH